MTDSQQIFEREIIILRKTAYGETSMVMTGLSREEGLIGAMVRGGRSVGGRHFPIIDVFRRVRALLKRGKGELLIPVQIDLIEDYAALTRNLTVYQTACWLARFALDNVMPGAEHPDFYQAMTVALTRLRDAAVLGDNPAAQTVPAVVGIAVAYLLEAGWLDHYGEDQDNLRKCRLLIEMAAGRVEVPDLGPIAWERTHAWALRQLRRVECRLPEDSPKKKQNGLG